MSASATSWISIKPYSARRSFRNVFFPTVVHICVYHVCIAQAIATHSVESATKHHMAGAALTDCPGSIAVEGWDVLRNTSTLGAREFLTGVEVFWNVADALFPVYRSAVLLFGGRGSMGEIKSDTWMIPMSRDLKSLPTPFDAALIETKGEEAPARWAHTAVWTGRGAEKAETWPTPRTYAGTIDENDDLVSAQGHPVQDIRHTISGKLHSTSTIAPCIAGNLMHKSRGRSCHAGPLGPLFGGCSCLRLEIQSKTKGVVDRDTIVNDASSPLYPSVWSGRRIEVIAGPGRGYQGFISYNGDNATYNLWPAVDLQFGMSQDTCHFVISEAAGMPTPSVPLDSMWVFGGRDNTSALTNSLYALTTSLPWELKGVTAGAQVDNTYSPTGLEDYTRSMHGWNYQTSPVRDFGSPERPTPQPAPVIVNQGAPQTSVCGEYGSILGGYQLLGPTTLLSKTYITSAVHSTVQISFDFIKIDFWDGQEAQMFVDGGLVWSQAFRSNTNWTASQEAQVCGRNDPPGFRGERLVTVNVTVPHVRPNVSITFRLNVSDSTTSTSVDCWWGLRKMYVRTLPAGFTWRKVAGKGQAPSPRAHHAAALFREMMFVFGGSTAKSVPGYVDEAAVFLSHAASNDTKLADLYAFNTTSETWVPITATIAEQARDIKRHNATAPIARSHHTFVKGRGDALMLYGGQAQSGLFISDVHVFQAREMIWETAITLGSGPGARAAHSAVTSGGHMWVYGGYRMDLSSRNIKLLESLYYLDLAELTWHEVAATRGGLLRGGLRYGSALVSAPGGSIAVVAGATATPRPGIPAVFPVGANLLTNATAPAVDISILKDALVARLVCGAAEVTKDPMLQRRAHLVCNSMGEIDWLRTEITQMQQGAENEILKLEKRLTAAYLASAIRRDQYGTDVDWLDFEVTKYTDLVGKLVKEGKIYTDQMSLLDQTRKNRVEMEIQYVFYMTELEGKKLALHMQLDETRQRYEKGIERLQLREAVFTRRKAEGALSAGTQHSCAINAQDRVQCWGLNDAHQSDAPRDIEFRSIASGDHHSCAIRSSDSRIQCWGSNTFGKSTPLASFANKPFIEISAGGSHVCGVQKTGEISCFGDNRERQSEAPSITNSTSTASGGGQFVMVSAGYAHTCALRAMGAYDFARRQGRIECWGKPADQRLKVPTGIFKWVSAGGKHSCAVDLQGHIHCWGSNSHKQIEAPRSTFSTVTAGHLHTCGIRSNGDAECWGSNVFGQAKVPPKRRWQVVSAGYEHTCGTDALRHQVVCWGKMVATPDLPTCARVWVQ